MAELFEISDVVKDKFLFASYSHDFKMESVIENVKALIEDGVRIWIDPVFEPGDDWEKEVELLLTHENCCGVVFFFSPNAVRSPNVGIERSITLEQLRKRGEKDYRIFYVNMNIDGRPTNYMNIIKRAFEEVSDSDVCRNMSFNDLKVIMELTNEKAVYVEYFDKEKLLNGITKKVPQVINKSEIILDSMKKRHSENTAMEIKLGSYEYKGIRNPLKWVFVKYVDDKGLLLLKDPLDSVLGSGLDGWLNGEFFEAAFNDEERRVIRGLLRLLTYAEAQELKEELLVTGQQWWLADTRGSLQMVVRDDGSIYSRGYNNKSFKNGVRPVITINMADAEKLMN